MTMLPQHLQRLEAEAIEVIRETAAAFRNPVLLYSIGKDSSVLLHLARKSFFPQKLSMPLMHVDTLWKFREMIDFRDETVNRLGLRLIVYTNPAGANRRIDPISAPSAHTQVMKTDALKIALDLYNFDAALGGARRDEEKSRAKERIFSLRSSGHIWNPRDQRPELWNLFNARLGPGETMRVFPLSNWTELDVWQYIQHQRIPVVDLYFARERPVVNRGGKWIVVDDNRFPLLDREQPLIKRVRFRTLGCYPLTAAVVSSAVSIEDIVREMQSTRTSERDGRLIDQDGDSSMETKKREGYF